MKTLYYFLAVCSLLSILTSCDGCKVNGKAPKTLEDATNRQIDTPSLSGIRMVQNQLVIRFPEDFPESDRQTLRNEVHATKKSACSCGESPIELWEIDPAKINLEEAVSKTTKKDRGLEGDYQFTFPMPDPGKGSPSLDSIIVQDIIEGGTRNILNDFIVDLNSSNINIAIIDSGFDLAEEMSPFLYPTGGIDMDCGEDHVSGWNFVDKNGDIRDTHSDGHGTHVTKVMMRELNDDNVSYSILPVKAFSDDGTGSYLDVICALNYIKEIQAKKGDIHIINASFGYDFGQIEDMNQRLSSIQHHRENSILASLIDDLSNSTLFIASAGNNGLNNDDQGNSHFPSDFTSLNVIGVGGFSERELIQARKSLKGNYGVMSIDLAAPYVINIDNSRIFGTSYGTAITSAKLAKFMADAADGDTAEQIKSNFFNSPFIQSHEAFSDSIDQGRFLTSQYKHVQTVQDSLIGSNNNVKADD